MYSKIEGKLIKGVIYDDADIEKMGDNIMDAINTCASNIKHGDPNTTAMIQSLETDYETLRDYVSGMGAIAAMTRYNFDTGVHHNLIIPKEALSVNLVNELEKIDMGKYVYDNYTEHFLSNRGILEVEEEPVKLNDTEEEKVLESIEKMFHGLPEGTIIAIHRDSDLGKVITNMIGTTK